MIKLLLAKPEDNLLHLVLFLLLTGNVILNHNLLNFILFHLFNHTYVLVALSTPKQLLTNVQLLFLSISQLNFWVELTLITKLSTLMLTILILYTLLQFDILPKFQIFQILIFLPNQSLQFLNTVHSHITFNK